MANGAGSANAGGGAGALSVSAALNMAKGALETVHVKLVGEVSELSDKAGYKAVYFTVKDEAASLPCMMWKNRYEASGVQMRVGMLVELAGRFTLYAAKGRMNFDVLSVSLAGEGRLRLQVAQLAKTLQAEGLMDAARKRPLPALPLAIGLVTSPRGAAVHDVLRTLRRRFPMARVLLAGVPVEGAQAAAQLSYALESVCAAGAEVVLLVRGGGSFEDLMPFNDEGLARTIASLPVPVVTGIGHEPDTCIADMVADLRASTPTAAAEAVSRFAVELRAGLESRAGRASAAMERRLEREAAHVQGIASRPAFVDPLLLFAGEAQTLDMLRMRLSRALPATVERERVHVGYVRDRLAHAIPAGFQRYGRECALRAARLNDLNPLGILARGYAVASDSSGAILKSVQAVEPGDAVNVRLHDGTLECLVQSAKTCGGATSADDSEWKETLW